MTDNVYLNRVKINSAIDVYSAIYFAEQQMKALGADKNKTTRFKTCVSELGQNILKYARKGVITIHTLPNTSGVRAVASDKGPGIADVGKALEDSFSTGGTLGLGLSGVKRMVDEFEINSEFNKGTTVSIILYIN